MRRRSLAVALLGVVGCAGCQEPQTSGADAGAATGPETATGPATDTDTEPDTEPDTGSEPAPDLDPSETCGLLEAGAVTLTDRIVLHDFDDPVAGCDADFGPSGIDYHPGLDVIVVASDKGQYALLSPDGGSVECYDLPGDNEGVTVVDGDDPRVVFVIEAGAGDGAGALAVVDLQTHTKVGDFVVDFAGGAVANDGVEGLAYTAGRAGLDAGFVVGDQTLGEGRSGCAVPWTDAPGDATPHVCAQTWSIPGLSEVTGADDDPGRGLLWLSSDGDDALVAVTDPAADPVLRIDLPTDLDRGQEGHAVVGCTLLLSLDDNDDARKVVRYTMAPG